MQKKPRWIGALIGFALVMVAVYSVFFVDWPTEMTIEPPPIRPLKTMAIESPFASSGRRYPAKVRANQEVDLAFQVDGPLIEYLIAKGQHVEKGQLLARIDPRDFESALQARQGVLPSAKSDSERRENLILQGHASEQERLNARAALEVAEAEVKIAAKALDDTYLRAPFSGKIADTFAEKFQDVRAKQPVLSLQEISEVEIEVSVPEERVLKGKGDRHRFRFVATFDYLPDREFDVKLKEFSTQAASKAANGKSWSVSLFEMTFAAILQRKYAESMARRTSRSRNQVVAA